jgi:hypothetical protein
LDHASHEAVVVQIESVSVQDADRVTLCSQASGEVAYTERILDRRSLGDGTIVAGPNKHDVRPRLTLPCTQRQLRAAGHFLSLR